MRAISRIVVIDDDPDIGELVCAVASGLCIEGVAVASIFDSLDPLIADADTIFVDLILPEKDGIEVLHYLCRRECRAQIVLMSGVGKRVLDAAKEVASSLGLEVLGNLYKPFTVEELEVCLCQSLAKVSGGHPARRSPDISIPDAEILQAIFRNEFTAFFQPIIEVASGTIVGVEALSRWVHPNFGVVEPGKFIAQAEDAGWISDLELLIIKQATSCVESSSWDPHNGLHLSLNVSIHSMLRPDYPDRMLALVRETKLAPQRITFEVTESGLLSELPDTLEVFTRLRMHGFGLSIDDYGTGSTMLKQLRLVPATELKIDRSLVRNISATDIDRIIIRKSIELGHELGMKVVMQGVESQDELGFARDYGCDFAQGDLFSPPLPASEISAWFKEWRL